MVFSFKNWFIHIQMKKLHYCKRQFKQMQLTFPKTSILQTQLSVHFHHNTKLYFLKFEMYSSEHNLFILQLQLPMHLHFTWPTFNDFILKTSMHFITSNTYWNSILHLQNMYVEIVSVVRTTTEIEESMKIQIKFRLKILM